MVEIPLLDPVTHKLKAEVVPPELESAKAESVISANDMATILAYIDTKIAETQPATATVETENYALTFKRYPDGFQSGRGFIKNTGGEDGIVVTLPEGFWFKEIMSDADRYYVGDTSIDPEPGGAIDKLRLLDQQPGQFTAMTTHIEGGLVMAGTNERLVIFVQGDWK
jgi:hypothetical protein